jgi:response regulator RpfG family c-di-GMP phosphodiesterase
MSDARSLEDPNLNHVLVVDDDEIVLTALKEQLPPMGYRVTACNNPTLALEALGREGFSVALVDNQMPGTPGLELLARVAQSHPHTTRLLLAGGMGLNTLTDAINEGKIYRYITKPWLREDLHVTLANAVERYRLVTEGEILQQRNITLNQQLGQAASAVTAGAVSSAGAVPGGGGDLELALGGFNKMLYTFHPNLGNTAQRAVAICQTLGEVLEMPAEQLRTLTLAAALHDIALVGINRDIVRRWLRDPAKCTDEEISLIKKHPEQSQQMLQYSPFFKDAADAVRSHHEHWDGTGYPDALKGETIPWLSRLLSVVIYFCNKHSSGVQLMAEIESHAETLFDPAAIRALVKAVPLTKMPRGEREILLIELKAGMILAKDIYNTNGHLLLPKGRELNDSSINKLWSINRVTPIDPLVLVFC